MKLRRFIAVLLFLTPALTFAQATRTWVSGVGDDANPCSRTAPGKTFAGAIAKTAAHGEINVLDPGGFGGVTITKSITIDGLGSEGGILVANTNGIIINAGDTDVVILRNLNLEGLRGVSGVDSPCGIQILNAGAVHIENCRITGFGKGISFESPAPGAQLFVNRTRIQKCLTDGIALEKGAATIRDTFVTDNISSSTAGMPPVTTYLGNGFRAAVGTRMTIEGCTSAGNNYGIVADGTIYLSTSTNNTVLGLKRTAPGAIISLRNNRIMGNAINGKVTKSIPQQ